MSQITGSVTNLVSSQTNLNDSATDFISLRVRIGLEIFNVTDGSRATVTGVLGNHSIMTSLLAGGSGNIWDPGDEYIIYSDAVGVTASFSISYMIIATVAFACKTIDRRVHGRKREYEIQRMGVAALYKNAWTRVDRDEYNGLVRERLKNTIIGPKDADKSGAFSEVEVKNPSLRYGPTVNCRVMYANPRQEDNQTPFGIITTGQALLSIPLSLPVRRGDLFKIHGKIYMVSERPVYEYWRNREIVGFLVKVVDVRNMQVDW